MKIFYHCYAGAHSSVVASALHCGKLPLQRVPTQEEIMAVPYYDRTTPEMIGTPYLMGYDEFGNEVYFIGMRRGSKLVKQAILSFMHICKLPHEQVHFIDALHVINLSTKIGGGLSRRLGCICFGRRLSAWGIQRCYQGFVDLVQHVKDDLVTLGLEKT
jgi:hypothetical protein